MIVRREDAEARLRRATRTASRSRLARLATHPWRLFYPRVLKALGRSRSASAQTFWTGRFEAVLPESVSTHIWRYGFFEDDVCLFLLRSLEPGMVFVDVGAHFGFFTLLGSELVGEAGRVVAVEPMPQTFAHLRRNVLLNCRFKNVSMVNTAAYSANTALTFQDYGLVDAGLNSAFGARTETAAVRPGTTVVVTARTFDDLVAELRLPCVDVIKIDAESSEMHVLNGAESVIRRFRPRIIVEVGDFDLPGVARSAQVVEWLNQRGYVAHEHANGEIVRHRVRETYGYSNLLFTRKEGLS